MRARLALALGLVFGLALMAWMVAPDLQRPLHADEAVQWSLLTTAEPHSTHQDRLHGPLLGLVARPVLNACTPSLTLVSEAQLRLIPLGWTLLLLLSLPWLAPPAWGLRHPLVFILLPLLALPAARFIQEWMMAPLLVVAGVLVLRAKISASPLGWFVAAGICAGLALACKVTALAYLSFGALAFYQVGYRTSLKSWGLATLVTVLTWVVAQSSFLTDLPALATWWLQLARALGLATGLSSPVLPMVEPIAWMLTGVTLAGLLVLRFILRDNLGRWGASACDAGLLTVVSVYLFHLVLPYKTPWLLATVDLACLAVLGPYLLLALPSASLRRALLVVSLGLSLVVPKWTTATRYDYVETQVGAVRLAATLNYLAAASTSQDPLKVNVSAASLRISVEQGHVWPLPFYLRDHHVAYGALPAGFVPHARLLSGRPGEAPVLAGYRPFPFSLRAGEVWWVYILENQAEAFRIAWAKADSDS